MLPQRKRLQLCVPCPSNTRLSHQLILVELARLQLQKQRQKFCFQILLVCGFERDKWELINITYLERPRTQPGFHTHCYSQCTSSLVTQASFPTSVGMPVTSSIIVQDHMTEKCEPQMAARLPSPSFSTVSQTPFLLGQIQLQPPLSLYLFVADLQETHILRCDLWISCPGEGMPGGCRKLPSFQTQHTVPAGSGMCFCVSQFTQHSSVSQTSLLYFLPLSDQEVTFCRKTSYAIKTSFHSSLRSLLHTLFESNTLS